MDCESISIVVQEDLLTTGQLAELVGHPRQWLDRVIRAAEGDESLRDDPFPAPEVTLPNGTRLFKRDPVLKWIADHPRRPAGRPPASDKSQTTKRSRSGSRGSAL